MFLAFQDADLSPVLSRVARRSSSRAHLVARLRMDHSIKNMATQFAGEDAEEIMQIRDLLLGRRLGDLGTCDTFAEFNIIQLANLGELIYLIYLNNSQYENEAPF